MCNCYYYYYYYPKRINTELPKTAAKPWVGTTWIIGWSTEHHTLPHIFGHIPVTGAYNHFIYLQYITTVYITTTVTLQIYKFTEARTRWPSCLTCLEFLHLQLHACTSTTVSLGETPVGSNRPESSHQWQHRSLTMGYQR